MSKIKNFIMLFFITLILFLIPNISKATVEVNRNVYSNNGSMKFTFTGLELDMEHEYEFGIASTKATQIENWFLVTEYTEDMAVVDLLMTTEEIREVINTTDTGYITIKDKTTDTVVIEPYAVDLKIPYLQVTNFTVIENGKEFGSSENETINVGMRNDSNSVPYYQYEKITDQSIIDTYKNIRAQKGDIKQMQDMLKQTPPTSNWSSWEYWNGFDYSTGLNGYGRPESPISVPDEGLYYMWVYFSGKDIKNVYGYILVDNLGNELSNNDDENQNNINNQNNIGNGNGVNDVGQANQNVILGSDSTSANKILPKAGKSMIIATLIILFTVMAVIWYVKNEKYKNIK